MKLGGNITFDIIIKRILRGFQSLNKLKTFVPLFIILLLSFGQSFSQQQIILNNDLPKSEIRYNSALLSVEINKAIDLTFDGNIKLVFGTASSSLAS